MIFTAAVLLTLGVIVFTLLIRPRDLPKSEPVSPVAHLDERRARIYDNLRDLQFEYRVGKLSEEDYQQTKLGLQKELASVMAEIDRLVGKPVRPAPPPAPPVAPPAATPPGTECPSCGAKFPRPMKFCGECGKAIPGGAA